MYTQTHVDDTYNNELVLGLFTGHFEQRLNREREGLKKKKKHSDREQRLLYMCFMAELISKAGSSGWCLCCLVTMCLTNVQKAIDNLCTSLNPNFVIAVPLNIYVYSSNMYLFLSMCNKTRVDVLCKCARIRMMDKLIEAMCGETGE